MSVGIFARSAIPVSLIFGGTFSTHAMNPFYAQIRGYHRV